MKKTILLLIIWSINFSNAQVIENFIDQSAIKVGYLNAGKNYFQLGLDYKI